MPWRNEINEVENVDHMITYEKNRNIIETNRKLFSIISDEELETTMDKVLNDIEENNMKNDEYETNDIFAEEHVDIFQQGGEKANNKKKKNKESVIKFTTPPRILPDQINEMFEKLNPEQKEFAMHVLNCFKLEKLPLKIFLNGSAGVAKSFLINLLYQLITNLYDNKEGIELDKMIVLLCAPPGKAAYIINGMTLHSAFSLPINQYSGQMSELSHDVANQIRSKLISVKLIIMDEVSMIGSKIFSQIDTRLRQITGINKPFGNISIIVVGDFMQLPPVRDHPIYQISNNHEFKDFFPRNPLWDEFKIYELKQIMRQKGEIEFIKALNNLAIQQMTENDIVLIRSCEVIDPNSIPKTAIRLY
ncbi:uncharacterized protein LOC130666895 [Microplitis mediator]|uniref:uncharacterized protein LOC130666895 n=1 Tax=Microplitis mediator TaxID=375433 RepID=UPI002552ED95|nr:uncharacterized protein LOC130666895 [Microplitis mediator]